MYIRRTPQRALKLKIGKLYLYIWAGKIGGDGEKRQVSCRIVIG
jgi:hypothetical protein